MLTRLFLAATIVATTIAAPAAAHLRSGTVPSATISYANLDLRSEAGQKTLKSRGVRAIREACDPGTAQIDAMVAANRCRKELTDKLDVKVASLISGRGLQRYAQAGVLAISLR